MVSADTDLALFKFLQYIFLINLTIKKYIVTDAGDTSYSSIQSLNVELKCGRIRTPELPELSLKLWNLTGQPNSFYKN